MLGHRSGESGRGADIGVQRFVAQALGGRCGSDGLDANFIGIVGRKVTHRMAGAALATGDDQAGNDDCADHAPDHPALGRIARSKSAGAQLSPHRPINAGTHRTCFRSERSGRVGETRPLSDQLAQVSQVVFSQLAAAVDSLCDVPGFGQFGGAVMSRMGIVMIDFGSQTGNSYLGSFLVIPMTVSL